MATITCPWCEEDEVPALAEPTEPGTSFTCADCGTTVTYVEEAPAPLDLAA